MRGQGILSKDFSNRVTWDVWEKPTSQGWRVATYPPGNMLLVRTHSACLVPD